MLLNPIKRGVFYINQGMLYLICPEEVLGEGDKGDKLSEDLLTDCFV